MIASSPRLVCSSLLAACLAACGAPSSSDSDAGQGPTDSGTTVDGGTNDTDGGAPGTDAGPSDAGFDAGPSDAGSSDAGGGGCPYLYCEDFESYDAGAVTNGEVLGPWKASVNGMGVMARIDGVNPRDGRHSYHVTVPADAGTRATLNQMNAAGLVPGNDIFGRVEIFYSDAGADGLPLNVHSWFFNASGKELDGGTSTMNLGGGGAKLQLNYHFPPTGAVEQSVQGGAVTAGVWHCIQWQYDGSGNPPANTANVWIDGTLAVTVPASKGWTFPSPWTSFDLGFTHYQSLANPVDVYLDDFAMDGAMIPCPP